MFFFLSLLVTSLNMQNRAIFCFKLKKKKIRFKYWAGFFFGFHLCLYTIGWYNMHAFH